MTMRLARAICRLEEAVVLTGEDYTIPPEEDLDCRRKRY
jgi:hypothetical protein